MASRIACSGGGGTAGCSSQRPRQEAPAAGCTSCQVARGSARTWHVRPQPALIDARSSNATVPSSTPEHVWVAPSWLPCATQDPATLQTRVPLYVPRLAADSAATGLGLGFGAGGGAGAGAGTGTGAGAGAGDGVRSGAEGSGAGAAGARV